MRPIPIREQCQHRWDDILLKFGVDQKILNKRHQSCVFCGGTDRANYSDKGGYGTYFCIQCAPRGIDGLEFLERFTGMNFKDIADEIESFIGTTLARPTQNIDLKKAKKKLNDTWVGSVSIEQGDPVHKYLCSRGLEAIDYDSIKGLKHHPGIEYWERDGEDFKMVGEYHAMVGLVRTPKGTPASLHVTYLTEEGKKADVGTVRKQMTPCMEWRGGAIRLEELPKGSPLCICEGIETALSIKLLFPDFYVWSCLNSGNLEGFAPPSDCSLIHIAGDNDYSYTGQAAAFAIAKELTRQGKEVGGVLLPDERGQDFNDVLLTQPE